MNGCNGQRVSHHIRSRSASRFFKAAKHAQSHGRPFNRHVTLNLSHTSCSTARASKAAAEIFAKYTRWLAHQSQKAIACGRPGYGRPTYQAVIEAPNGIHHIHWLVHVPPEVDDLFRAKVPKWLVKVCGPVHKHEGAIDIGHITTVMALSRYCMKGVDPYQAKRYFVRPVGQGIVTGKRVTISRCLGPVARRREQAEQMAVRQH